MRFIRQSFPFMFNIFLTLTASTLFLFFGCSDSDDSKTGAISGNISKYEISAEGAIYVVAVNTDDAPYLRNMETEPYPYLSQYASGSQRLEEPGDYVIAGLTPGEYIVWAYMDTGGDGGVDHYDFADPVGWYQTSDNLRRAPVIVEQGEISENTDIVLYQPVPFDDDAQVDAWNDGGGALKTIKGNHVLHLWGKPEERAYSIGYLCAQQILDWLNFVVIEQYCGSTEYYENSFIPSVQAHMGGLFDRYSIELDSLLLGMYGSGIGTYSFRLERYLNLDDLAGINSFYFLANTLIFGPSPNIQPPSCSSAVLWGEKTANSELNGGLIHAKNMDGENDCRKITVNDLLIVAVEPEPASSDTQQFIGINWPGFIGADMGMNESGLIMAPHSVLSMPDWDKTNMLDYDLLYRETLETCSTPQEAWNYWTSTSATTRTGGFNTAVSGKYLTSEDYPSLTFEIDSYGGEIRYPDFMEPLNYDDILTTNTFFKYQGANPEALAPGSYHAAIEADNYRYTAMLEKITEFENTGQTIYTEQMIEILKAASRTEQYSGITEYSFIGYPDSGSFALAKEDLINKILEAPYAAFSTYSFDEVFHGSED